MNTETLHVKAFSADMSILGDSRAFIAKITSDAVDRDREVLLPDGMDATDFEKNPVVFFGHDYTKLPVGKVTSLKRNGDHWLAKVQMAERPEGHDGEWVPDTIFSLIKQGVIRGVSVGFEITSLRDRPTPADREKFGDTVRGVISRWKLMELSIAPLPANQEALIMAVSKGVKAGSIAADTAKRYMPAEVAERVAVAVPVHKERKTYTLKLPDVATARQEHDAAIRVQIKEEVARTLSKKIGALYYKKNV